MTELFDPRNESENDTNSVNEPKKADGRDDDKKRVESGPNAVDGCANERIQFGYAPETISIDEMMRRQGYAKAGAHSAVKTCTWLKNSMNGEGVCYKASFYGVVSHRCLQMTPTLSCNQECIFCWRPTEVAVKMPKDWDAPEKIVEESIKAQRKLITGFGGSPKAVTENYDEAKTPSNVAISLSGEPTFYPYLPELIKAYEKQKMTVFVVSNGTNPEMLRRIHPTQLYMSLDAVDLEMYNRVCRPKSPHLWDNILESLRVLKEKKEQGVRTVVRITAVTGLNMENPQGFAQLLQIAEPNFIEVKSYMHVGFSRLRLSRQNMAEQEEIRRFANEIAKYAGYQFAGESEPSRVVVLSKDGKLSKV
jgi:tRNA wybutosine-synthesizing protein 1